MWPGASDRDLNKHAALDTMAAYVVHFWEAHLAHHFQQEEALLLPLLSKIYAADIAERMLDEHRLIRELVALASDKPDRRAQTLAELVQVMKPHIRFEERKLFPTLEKQASQESLHEIGAQLQTTHLQADLSWDPAFWE